ncbi:conserved virulence factor C family protein [Bacillus sp. SM2101]|uniref:conserved virulence factor C family protein n=1 Tax=Bacillus sp. SM2101 TaxID=2805366 RepID=UPI001BDEA193|nr:conserved virulence factor C family protein [Bacillus sp. SM2101]
MKINTIEPTPSPNTMKIILNKELPSGKSNNYKRENSESAPQIIQDILSIDGVKGVYHVADFLAVERNAKYDWQEILPKVREAFGEDIEESSDTRQEVADTFGDVKVFVQMIQFIPMQVKLLDGQTEKRYGLPERFKEAVLTMQSSVNNVVSDRQWQEYGTRYGDIEDVGSEVVEELIAVYDEDRLNRLVDAAKKKDHTAASHLLKNSYKVTAEMLENADWTKRYAALEQMEPTEEDIPVLAQALNDDKASIRRLATVYLGMIEKPVVLPYLYKALTDKSITVRRTAGDCLSDIGDPSATGAMIKALQDPSKLVRWRAAMFLYEVGDDSALPALIEAQNDPEFEVSMQMKLAIERIKEGEEAKGSVWKQMTDSRNNKD